MASFSLIKPSPKDSLGRQQGQSTKRSPQNRCKAVEGEGQDLVPGVLPLGRGSEGGGQLKIKLRERMQGLVRSWSLGSFEPREGNSRPGCRVQCRGEMTVRKVRQDRPGSGPVGGSAPVNSIGFSGPSGAGTQEHGSGIQRTFPHPRPPGKQEPSAELQVPCGLSIPMTVPGPRSTSGASESLSHSWAQTLPCPLSHRPRPWSQRQDTSGCKPLLGFQAPRPA